MKYSLNNFLVDYKLNQESISDEKVPFPHVDLIHPNMSWYKKGFTSILLSEAFMQNVRTKTLAYLQYCLQNTAVHALNDFPSEYHVFFKEREQHLAFLNTVGKVLDPKRLGIDTHYLEKQVQKATGWKKNVTCTDVCDIRVFRPYKGAMMDNNPLHRDTWKKLVTNCVNMYIPICGNNEKSSLALIEGSHLWDRKLIERTKENAFFNNVQYGIPAVSKINKTFNVVRPVLKENEVLLFSSNMIHGGSINLNEELTRVSIEIRFWEQAN